ncbi:endonuclease [Streptococcus bovimastitidis]|uniref:Endonuclease n=1 Tax=Streptococcus bovimastitidis TaxID=1856638 RepID=A0A1L8MMK5_9STRE|nr:Z1 domain-containing protein [Streptococcus bovimastitidis]OJF72010.1 endonuclease [Streptococcus bovimastitidis]
MIDYDKINKHFETARSAIIADELSTKEEITEHLLKLNKILFEMDDVTFEELVRQVFSTVDISLESGNILTKQKNSNWFVDSRSERGQRRFTAYEKYLAYVSHYSSKTITGISNSMDKVMNNIGDPNLDSSFSVKGLVIGDVQSGKTGNFIALMNKAADAGYNVIIVTTGTIEKLRRQTQERIEQGFGGFDSGEFDISKTIKRWDKDLEALMITTKDADFKKNVNFTTGISKSVPMVAVIKKNKTSLESLASWLEKHNGLYIDRSLLFIDDEADNATINTRNSEDPTTINKGIRKILSLFKRSSYVGFTATPFANILIDHNENKDLFPTDFIQILDTPTNYMGANVIFPEGSKYHSILKYNDDAEDLIPLTIPKSERLNFLVEDLPASLKRAIKIFFLQNTIRDLRGDKSKHRSMLVNVSYLTHIQEQVKELIENEVGELKRNIKLHILQKDNSIHKELEKLFNEEFYSIPETWEDVYRILYQSTDSIITEVINAKNKSFQYEDFPNGARVIAVGGFALSRGLTLEGLSISYLYRNTLMYDTLMQMGRWFGYRPNYDDIVKLYMPARSIDWYSQIMEAVNDLKNQIISMVNQHKTPEEFGLYIKDADNQDEAILLITSRNKMKNALSQDVNIRISGDFKETTKLSKDNSIENRKIINEWININREKFDNNLLIKNADISIVESLLKNYDYGSYNKLNSYVIDEVIKEFKYFDVQIAANEGSSLGNLKNKIRSFRYEPKLKVVALSNSRLGSPTDGKFGLSKEQVENAKEKKFNQQKQYFSEFSQDERNPLIVLYPLTLNPKDDEDSKKFASENEGETFWAISLGVPRTNKKTLTYKTKMNTVLQQQLIEGDKIDILASSDEEEDDIE